MAFNNAFVMPTMNQGQNGAWQYAGANVPYQDNATALGTKFGWDDPRTQAMLTRDNMRYGNGQIMYGMGQGFGGLGTQMATGFNDLADAMQYGGVYGESQNRVFSPQSRNGYSGGWSASNPFMVATT